MDAEQIEQIVDMILYGDVHETPIKILGKKCPSQDKWEGMDEEQHLRLAIAATVKEKLRGHKFRLAEIMLGDHDGSGNEGT